MFKVNIVFERYVSRFAIRRTRDRVEKKREKEKKKKRKEKSGVIVSTG